jgi:cysteine desulfurase
MVYLDYNASAPMPACVVDAMTAAMALMGNPSSVHGYGRAARAVMEAAREDVAVLVGARARDVVFTSGATEANLLALSGSGRRRILVSAMEHVSVLDAAPDAERIPVRPDGVVDLDALSGMLAADDTPALVSVMLANNETGVIQPIAAVAALAAKAGALLHCDAVQGPGRIPVDIVALGVDFLTLSAHKFGGPKGVGALILRDGVRLAAVTRGGGQERGLRGGTENVPGIAGFGAAARYATSLLAKADAVAGLRDRLEAKICALMPAVVIFGADAPRLPNTSCFALPGLAAETQVMALDLAGFAVSAGAACSSGKVQASHVLRAMGADDRLAGCAIRVSLGPDTTEAEVDAFAAVWRAFVEKAGRSAA